MLGLGAGLYRVVASHPRHVQVVDPVVRVVRNKTIPVEFVLRAGVSDEIVVVASAIRKDAYGSVGASFLDREALRTAAGVPHFLAFRSLVLCLRLMGTHTGRLVAGQYVVTAFPLKQKTPPSALIL